MSVLRAKRVVGRILGAVAWVLLVSDVGPVQAENWPQWRGPAGTGVSQQKQVPVFWNEQRSIVWKCPLPEWGTSTPAIWENALFVTSHDRQGRLLLMRIDKPTGRIVWTRTVGQGEAVRQAEARQGQKFHRLHNLASPSPVTDGERVVAHFGNGDLAAYNFDGRLLWKRNLQDDYGRYTIWWGHANSPVLYDNLVISVCMQDSLSDLQKEPVESYLVAHDLRDGHQRWKRLRMTGAQAEQCDAYTTPLLVEVDGRTQMVVMGGNQLDAYDPATGEQLWYLPKLVGGRTVTGPTAGLGRVFATRGMRGPLIAVPLDLSGERNYRDIQWRYNQGTPDTCSPVLWDTLLYTITDDGILRCFDALNGHLHWRQRLKGTYKASPVAVDGRVFFFNTDGLCTVISASSRFDRITENQLDDEIIASPALADGRFFIRGRKTLYCIGL